MSMSRMLIAIPVLLASPVAEQSPDAIATYARLTSVEPRCARPADSREILVCGARKADRWRVPFIGYEAGDPRNETVEGERKRLASAPRPKCGNEWVLRNCGMVGVSVGVQMTPEGLRARPLAP